MSTTTEVARPTAPKRLHLIASVAERLVAFELAEVAQVVPMLLVDPIPGGPAGLMGFANLAGEPVAVLKVRALFGLPDVADDTDHRIVVCGYRDRLVGLVVDEVMELAEPTARRSPTVDDRIVAVEVVRSLGLLGGRLCLVLDPGVVIDWLTRVLEPASPSDGGTAEAGP